MSVVLAGIAAGYLANKLGILGGETDRKLTKLILTITMPAMTLGSSGHQRGVAGPCHVGRYFWRPPPHFFIIGFAPGRSAAPAVGGTAEQKERMALCAVLFQCGVYRHPGVHGISGRGAMLYAVILTLPFNLIFLLHGSRDPDGRHEEL